MDKNIQLYCGDCLEIMSTFSSESIDLCFLDPPFNLGKKYKLYNDKRDDYWEWVEKWFSEVVRLLKSSGSVYFMHYEDGLFEVLKLVEKFKLSLQNIIIWKNVTSVHSKTKFVRAYQPIVFATKSASYYFDTYFETRENRFKLWGKKRQKREKGQLLDIWDDIPFVFAGSVIHKEAILEPGTRRKAHPCQMPEALSTRIVGFSCPSNGVVLDPFMGSGTVAASCLKLGRGFIGIELDPYYLSLVEKRINDIKNNLMET